MNFFQFIFYRYYSYLFSSNRLGDDLLKAQFALSMFQFFNLVTVIVYVKNIFRFDFFTIFHFLIIALLFFLWNKFYFDSKRVELLIEKYKNKTDLDAKAGNFIMIFYFVISLVLLVTSNNLSLKLK
jgi:hypothetical protein